MKKMKIKLVLEQKEIEQALREWLETKGKTVKSIDLTGYPLYIGRMEDFAGYGVSATIEVEE